MLMSSYSEIPVTVLTSYLGSGKTTLLNRILSSKSDRHKRCLAMFAAGVGLLALAKLGPVGERWEPWTVASGATLLATAHLVNLRLCRQCARCEAEEPFA